MTAKFCILIPSKVFQIEKHFLEKLETWMTKYQAIEYNNYGLSRYSVLTLSEFMKRPDVNLDLPNQIYNRYHVIDWDFYFMPSSVLRSFVCWLAEIYVYGEVGLLKYWSDQLRRFPLIKIANTQQSIADLSADQLPLDQLLFFPLKQQNATD